MHIDVMINEEDKNGAISRFLNFLFRSSKKYK